MNTWCGRLILSMKREMALWVDFFENMFDFNKDGKVDGFERAMGFMFIEEMVKADSDGLWR